MTLNEFTERMTSRRECSHADSHSVCGSLGIAADTRVDVGNASTEFVLLPLLVSGPRGNSG